MNIVLRWRNFTDNVSFYPNTAITICYWDQSNSHPVGYYQCTRMGYSKQQFFNSKKNLLPHMICGKFILNNMQPGSDLKYNYRDVNGLSSFHNCCCLNRWKICVFLNSWKMKLEFFTSLTWPPPFCLLPQAILVVLKILTPTETHSVKLWTLVNFLNYKYFNYSYKSAYVLFHFVSLHF